jgi:hypothetical protein
VKTQIHSFAEIARLRKIESAAQNLLDMMDFCCPSWRNETLGLPDGVGDEVNRAWDKFINAMNDGMNDK